jgi:hypothetical protein
VKAAAITEFGTLELGLFLLKLVEEGIYDGDIVGRRRRI